MDEPARHLNDALTYPKKVVAGKIKTGKWVKLACARFERDLKAALAGDGQWIWDEQLAVEPILFAGLMQNVKGPKAGEFIELMPFQKWMVANLFGFIDRKTGHRRFRQASIWMPKGNGKTTLAATIALYVCFTKGEGGAEGYSAAVSLSQAKLAFDTAKMMVAKNPAFRNQFGVQANAHTINQLSTGSRFQAITGQAKGLDGVNVHFALLDEIGSHKTSGIYDVLITATGKRTEPLLISISTATDNTTGIGRQVWNYTEQVLSGQLRDERFFGIIYAADQDEDVWSEATWRKANPGWGDLVQPDALRANAKQALASPALQAAFKTRHLNIWVAAQNPLFDRDAWDACADPDLTIEDLRGQPCYAALDMAARTDLAAGVLVFPIDVDGETHYRVFAKTWLPDGAVDSDRNPLYVQWAEDEALTVTPGQTTDFAAVEDWIRRLSKVFDLRQCAYDPYMLMQMSQRLQNDGYPMKEYRASTLNFSEPTKMLDALMRERKIKHDGDPVLAWCIGNVVGHYDARSNVYPKREFNEKKIDAAIALIMALGVQISSEYESNGYAYADGRELLVF